MYQKQGDVSSISPAYDYDRQCRLRAYTSGHDIVALIFTPLFSSTRGELLVFRASQQTGAAGLSRRTRPWTSANRSSTTPRHREARLTRRPRRGLMILADTKHIDRRYLRRRWVVCVDYLSSLAARP